MSDKVTAPLNFALTGPILMVATAWKPVSDVLSSDSQPGMQALSTRGSLSFSHTVCCGAGPRYPPFILIAMSVPPCARAADASRGCRVLARPARPVLQVCEHQGGDSNARHQSR